MQFVSEIFFPVLKFSLNYKNNSFWLSMNNFNDWMQEIGGKKEGSGNFAKQNLA